jgi:hypothetical protein
VTAAADLRVGDVTPAVPLNGDATILFVYPYTDQAGKARVFIAYKMPDGWVDSTTYLPTSDIPLTSRGRPTFKVGDRFLLPAGDGTIVRTGTITHEIPGKWQITTDPYDHGDHVSEGFTTWKRSEDLLPTDASRADIDAYVKRWQARAYPNLAR